MVNPQRYDPAAGDERCLHGLPRFGLDRLTADPAERAKRTLPVCEGPWDLPAAAQQLTARKTRTRFDLLALPAADTFKPERADRLVYDHNKAGRDGLERTAKVVAEQRAGAKLFALRWPDGTPDKCDIGDLARDGVSAAEFTRKNRVPVAAPEPRLAFARGARSPTSGPSSCGR